MVEVETFDHFIDTAVMYIRKHGKLSALRAKVVHELHALIQPSEVTSHILSSAAASLSAARGAVGMEHYGELVCLYDETFGTDGHPYPLISQLPGGHTLIPTKRDLSMREMVDIRLRLHKESYSVQIKKDKNQTGWTTWDWARCIAVETDALAYTLLRDHTDTSALHYDDETSACLMRIKYAHMVF